VEKDTKNGKLNKALKNRLKRGAVLGVYTPQVVFVILFLFRENLTVGAVTAAPSVIPVYFVLGRFF